MTLGSLLHSPRGGEESQPRGGVYVDSQRKEEEEKRKKKRENMSK